MDKRQDQYNFDKKRPSTDIIGENIQYDRNNFNNVIENNNQNIQANVPTRMRKNRTLQYYKFLFYSMKVEIKITEIINIIRFSNTSEILLWILSFVLINDFSKIFVIVHFLHFLRGILGFFLLWKMPKSYNLVEGMESEKNKTYLEKNIFNDYTRKIMNIEIFENAKSLKILTLIYLILNLINIFVDLIDFLNGLSKFGGDEYQYTDKINLMVNFMIAILYLAVDFSYIFWFQTLKYTFPQHYLSPLSDAFSGLYSRTKAFFKFGKKETDLKTEELMNNKVTNQTSNINGQIKDMEINPINNKINDQINPQMDLNYGDYQNQQKNNTYGKRSDNIGMNYPIFNNNRGYEENLDN